MKRDTNIGGAKSQFPATRWSAIVAARSSNQAERSRAFDILIAAYWKPVYKYIRIKYQKSNEDAKDLTQGFFATVLEKDFFNSYDSAKARFRTFLRTCLDGYLANQQKAARRIKRGGDAQIFSMDFENAEGELIQTEIPAADSMENFFDWEWTRSLFSLAIDQLREECHKNGKSVHFQLFEKYDLAAEDSEKLPSYQTLAAAFDLPVTKVTNYLAFARREFRRIVLENLRQLTSNDDEFRQEVRAVLGIDPP